MMNDRTLTALYQTRQDAEAARERLKADGFTQDVDIHDEAGSDAAGPHGEGGFMEKMKDFFAGHEDTHAYREGVRRGHYLLTVKVYELDAERAAALLDATNGVELDRAESGWRNEGWTPGLGATAAGAGTVATGSTRLGTDRLDQGRDEQMIPVVEERLRVGKREVERGGVRVRSYVIEEPVHDQIGLREEHVSVERRPVDRAVTGADAVFQDRDIQLTERSEEAVVGKETFVKEEILVRKDASERVQEVNDTVRRTEVEVSDTAGAVRSSEEPVGVSPVETRRPL